MFEPSLRMGVRSQIESAVEMLMRTPSFSTQRRDRAAGQRRQLSQILESHVMASLHTVVFSWLQNVHTEKTEQLERTLMSMLDRSQVCCTSSLPPSLLYLTPWHGLTD